MIRHSSTFLRNKENTFRVESLTSIASSNSSNTGNERAIMTSTPPCIHYCFGNVEEKKSTKGHGLRDVCEKRDGVGGFAYPDPPFEFRDDFDAPESKEREEQLKTPCGGSLDSYSTEYINSLASFLDESCQDQYLFPWKELENDLHILANRHMYPAVTDISTNFHQVGLAFVPAAHSAPSSMDHLLSRQPSPVPASFQTQTLCGTNGTNRPIEGHFNRESSGEEIRREDSNANSREKHNFIGENNTSPILVSSRRVRFLDKNGRKSNHFAPATSRHKHWTEAEDEILRRAMAEEHGDTNWGAISTRYFRSTRSGTQCKNRWRNHLQPGIIRGDWKPAEDKLILAMVKEGHRWRDISEHLPGRVGEHIRQRYVNYLDPTLKKTKWTKEEDKILFETQRRVGNKWSEIRKFLPGRSDNSIKNRYHNRKTSQLRKMNLLKQRKARKASRTRAPAKPSEKTRVDPDNRVSMERPTSVGFADLPDIIIGV